MEKNCDLELRLFPTSSCITESDNSVLESRSSGNSLPKEDETRLTIFYDGNMCVYSNVTHHQAKSIISMASREMEERSSSNGSDPRTKSIRLNNYHQQLPNPKAAMKRSLQSFLQKRQTRLQATSPYHQHSRR